MTIASILEQISIVDNELDVSANGADESRCITALDMAQNMFESILANHPDTLGTIGTVATVAGQQYSNWPTGLLRLDNLYLLNSEGRQVQQINIIQDVGGQSGAGGWPWNSTGFAGSGSGSPRQAYTNRQYLFWSPIPDAVYTLRTYGLVAKTDLTSRDQTFEYPDEVSTPLAIFADRLLSIGVGDPSDELRTLAEQMFAPVINMLRKPTRQRPQSRQYSRTHTT